MKKQFQLLLALGALAVTSLATPGFAATNASGSTAATALQRVDFPNEYEHGFYDGAQDATANKCNYANNPGAYEDWYYQARQYALDRMMNPVLPNDYEFWSGYYSGLENGYYTQVVCGGTGGSGGGGGPIDEPQVGG